MDFEQTLRGKISALRKGVSQEDLSSLASLVFQSPKDRSPRYVNLNQEPSPLPPQYHRHPEENLQKSPKFGPSAFVTCSLFGLLVLGLLFNLHRLIILSGAWLGQCGLYWTIKALQPHWHDLDIVVTFRRNFRPDDKVGKLHHQLSAVWLGSVLTSLLFLFAFNGILADLFFIVSATIAVGFVLLGESFRLTSV